MQVVGTAQDRGPGPRGRLVAACCLSLCCLCAGCANLSPHSGAVAGLAPLRSGEQVVAVAEVAGLAPTPELLAPSPEMVDFVERYDLRLGGPRQRLHNLHTALKSPAMLGLTYDPRADGAAAEVFARGSANCLSYAHLFVSLAREIGLDARYQWLEVRPQWTRLGERAALRLHVNVLVTLRRGDQYMVDIDPLPTPDIAGSRSLSDADAAALHHNNLAMEALSEGDLAAAWPQLVRGLQLSPGLAPLWVNLGAVYRAAEQLDAAERSYLRALAIDGGERSAMNNLVVLYKQQGRPAEQARWERRVADYRERNPYYHTWQGDQAAEQGDWDSALDHYRQALSLKPGDSRLIYAMGIIQYQRGARGDAVALLEQAIDSAPLRGEQEEYRARLDTWRRQPGSPAPGPGP